MRLLPALLLTTIVAPALSAQWDLQDSHTTASLRGIHNVGGGVAWASGTEGTVLRTEDGGYLWQGCATPPGAEHLDFRGIQAFDENTAIVMSSGKGDLSRLYKTTDGCRTWKLVFTNPDKDGFWDSLRKVTTKQLYLMGDPVDGRFSMFYSPDSGDNWFIADDPGLDADKNAGAFAAGNTALLADGPFLLFATGGTTPPHVFYSFSKCDAAQPNASCPMAWGKSDAPLAGGSASAGIFSLAARNVTNMSGKSRLVVIAVGGTYDKPTLADGTAATSNDGGKTWTAAGKPPGGYRSAVDYDAFRQNLITVGPNGTDLSTDDGRNWRALKPGPSEPSSADRDWNALSLPFVVGPKGRIGRLRADALPKPTK